MDDRAAQIVKAMVERFGPEVLESGPLFDSVSADLFGGDYRTERRIMLTAVEQGVPAAMRARSAQGMAGDVVVSQAAQRLRSECAMDPTAAQWVAATLAAAQGIHAGAATIPRAPNKISKANPFVVFGSLAGLLIALVVANVIHTTTVVPTPTPAPVITPVLFSTATPGLLSTATPAPKVQTDYVIWTLVGNENYAFLDSVSYPIISPCLLPPTLTVAGNPRAERYLANVKAYYADWNAKNLNAAWALLSLRYQLKYGQFKWLLDHNRDASIAVTQSCVLNDYRVGVTVESTPR